MCLRTVTGQGDCRSAALAGPALLCVCSLLGGGRRGKDSPRTPVSWQATDGGSPLTHAVHAGPWLIQASSIPWAWTGHRSVRPGGVPDPQGGRRAPTCRVLTKTLLTPRPCPPPRREPGGRHPSAGSGRRAARLCLRVACGTVVLRTRRVADHPTVTGGPEQEAGTGHKHKAPGKQDVVSSGRRTRLASPELRDVRRDAELPLLPPLPPGTLHLWWAQGFRSSWAFSGCLLEHLLRQRTVQGRKGQELLAERGPWQVGSATLKLRSVPSSASWVCPAPGHVPQPPEPA